MTSDVVVICAAVAMIAFGVFVVIHARRPARQPSPVPPLTPKVAEFAAKLERLDSSLRDLSEVVEHTNRQRTARESSELEWEPEGDASSVVPGDNLALTYAGYKGNLVAIVSRRLENRARRHLALARRLVAAQGAMSTEKLLQVMVPQSGVSPAVPPLYAGHQIVVQTPTRLNLAEILIQNAGWVKHGGDVSDVLSLRLNETDWGTGEIIFWEVRTSQDAPKSVGAAHRHKAASHTKHDVVMQTWLDMDEKIANVLEYKDSFETRMSS